MKKINQFVSRCFGIFSETNPSSMIRVMSFCMFLVATHITYIIIQMRPGPLGQFDFYTIIGLYSLAFFPKVIQKFMEKGIPNTGYSGYYDAGPISNPPIETEKPIETVNYQNIQP